MSSTKVIRLRDLIKLVRQCKTAAEERTVIAKECANIRNSFREQEGQYRHRNIAKLLFIHMLGYPTHFGQMECLKLIVSNSYSDKRMGYLGLMLLLDERQEVLMLVTNSLQNDLNHPNQYVVGLALCSLANISSTSIARDLAPNVVKLLGASNPYIKKKAALCAIRIVRKVPELMEQFVPKVRPLLTERNHGVLITAVSLMIELCQMDDQNRLVFRKMTPSLVKILKNLVLSGYAPEHDVNGVTDPFLQVKLLILLRLIGREDKQASDVMNDILAQVATNTENTRNVGNAILYECVQTIMHIDSETGLRVLAVNILGRFLQNKDNNIRYVALNTLRRVVAADHQAVQRHRQTIVECLKDHDVTIRRRALDLVYALVNETNIKTLMRELLNYLLFADYETRIDLTAKICWVTEKYAPNARWHLDTILRVMAISGDNIPEEVVASTIHLIIETPEIQQYAVQKLFTVLSKEILRQPLVQTGVWCLGEFGDLLLQGAKNNEITTKDIINLLDNVLKHPSSTTFTKAYVVTAMVKLTERLKTVDGGVTAHVGRLLAKWRPTLQLELQQRACEYSALLLQVPEGDRAVLLEKVPALDPDEVDDDDDQQPQQAQQAPEQQQQAAPQSQEQPPPQEQKQTDLLGDLLGGGPTTTAPAQQQQPDILGDLLGGGPTTPSPTPTQPPASGGGSLLDMLSSGPAQQPTPQQPPAGGIPDMVAFEKGGVRVMFSFVKRPDTPNMTLINVSTSNATAITLNNYLFQAAVPKFMQIQLNPPSGNVVPPHNSGAVTQQMMINNSLYGQRPPVMKIKVDFTAKGQAVSDEATLTTFPSGV